MASCLSIGTIIQCRVTNFNGHSASASFITGFRTTNAATLRMKSNNQTSSGMLSAFTPPPSSLSFASASSFAGNSLGRDLKSSIGGAANRRRSLVVRAVKYSLCQTKRNRSRKSLARTHGFRKRMSTTKGRATIKRRRAKGRWKLCTKTNPNSGKRRP